MLDLNLYNIANRINNFIKYNTNYRKQDVYKCIYKMYIEKLLHGIETAESFNITITVDAPSKGLVEISGTGDIIDSQVSDDKGVYTFTISVGGDFTMTITPDSNYLVQKLNIDTVNKGTITSYSFTNVLSNHTGYLWMEEIPEENPVAFLVRSDKPTTFYSSTQDVFDSLILDYPIRLTLDVTITCVKTAKESRNTSLGYNIATIKYWNNGGIYKLTIDGNDLLTYDCKSLSGIRFYSVSNVIMKNISFINFGNYGSAYSPDEEKAVISSNKPEYNCVNFVITKCTFNGMYPDNISKLAYYTMRFENISNITLCDNYYYNNYGMTAVFNNCTLINISKNIFNVNYSLGVVAHPAIIDITSSLYTYIEDNEFSGNLNEDFLRITNPVYLYINRNKFIGGGGHAIGISALNKSKFILIESNLFDGMLLLPIYAWYKEVISIADTENLVLNNNTFIMSSTYYEQNVLRGTSADNLTYTNNLFIRTSTNVDANIKNILLNYVKTLTMNDNLYQVIVDDNGNAVNSSILVLSNDDELEDCLTIKRNVNKIVTYLNLGYESRSAIISKADPKIIDNDNKILSEIDAIYLAGTNSTSYDLAFTKKSTSNSRGCYNLHGTIVDETAVITGYSGYNVDEDLNFTSNNNYLTYADDELLITHNNPSRSFIPILLFISDQYSTLLMGKRGIVSLSPKLDINNEYVSSASYDINIDY